MTNRLFVCAMIAMALSACPASGCAANEEGLPEITEWEDGKGLDKSGRMIVASWAYDTINPAGKYVLLGKSGNVLRRQDRMDDEDVLENSYTATESDPGRFAVRCDVFSGFMGSVNVTLQERSGKEVGFTLDKGHYEGNLSAGSGTYHIQSADAEWEGTYYRVSFPDREFALVEGKMLLLRLEVTCETEGNIEETEPDTEGKHGETQETEADENTKDEETKTESGVRERMSKKKAVMFISAVIAGLLGFVMIKKRKSKA